MNVTGFGMRRPVSGLSLIELMVALVLSSIVIGGAVSIYLASKNSFVEVEQVAELSENGRFATESLAYSLRHIGFFGGAGPGDSAEAPTLDAVVNDCTGAAAVYDTANHFFAVRATATGMLGCISDAVVNTDILIVKGVSQSPLFDNDPADPNLPRDGVISFPRTLDTEQSYVIANSEVGLVVDGADTPPSVSVGSPYAQGVAWPYEFQIFYVRDGEVPSLSRKYLQWNGTAMEVQTEELVFGVDNLRFLFGYDSNNDGEVDVFENLTNVTAANRWDRVMKVRTYVLLRSSAGDPGYANEKSYLLGDMTVTPGDNVRRLLVQTDVTIRNRWLANRSG